MGHLVCLAVACRPISLSDRTHTCGYLAIGFGIAFILRSFQVNQWRWLSAFWVRSVSLFWLVALLASALSENPLYSLGEAVAWIRFPLYAAACMFWLGTSRVRLNMMFVTMGVATAIMVVILAVELGSAILLSSTHLARLSGPYGDLVPGSFLGKAMMPLATILRGDGHGQIVETWHWSGNGQWTDRDFHNDHRRTGEFHLAGLAVFLASFAWVVRPRRIILFGTLAATGFFDPVCRVPGHW